MVGLWYGPGALFYVVFAFSLSLVTPTIVNRTIDDSFGDSQTGQLVTYLPATLGVWKTETCLDCAILPDTLQTFEGTYTAATYNPGLGSISATMQFNGTAIYVFFILANNAGEGITSITLANFTLDGGAPQLFQHAPDLTTTDIEYNALAFSQTNLTNAQHTLLISTSGVNENVYVNFDYAIYTHDDDAPLLPLPVPGTSSAPVVTSTMTSSSSSASYLSPATPTSTANIGAPSIKTSLNDSSGRTTPISAGAVAGGVIAGLLALAILTLIFFFLRRRKLQKSKSRDEGSGYVPPLMIELGPQREQETGTAPMGPRGPFNALDDQLQGDNPHEEGHNESVRSRSQRSTPSLALSPMSTSNDENPYGGYVTPISPPAVLNSDSTSSSFYYNERERPARLRATNGHYSLASPASLPASSYMPSTEVAQNQPNSRRNTVADVRRARQQELDQRLRTVQQEMYELATDLNNGGIDEKGGRHRSLARQRSMNGNRSPGAASAAEEEMSVDELKEQLRAMRQQVVYLQEQQRSAWAQGLSDDPPPGYTPARITTRYSQPSFRPPST